MESCIQEPARVYWAETIPTKTIKEAMKYAESEGQYVCFG